MPDVRQCLASECPRVLHFARARHVSSPVSARRTGIPPFCELNATFPCLRPPRVRNLPFLPPSSLPARALPAVPVRCPGSSRPQTSRVGQALFLSPSRPFPVLRHISPVISSLGRHGGSPAPPAAPPSELSENYRSSTPRQSSTASPNPGHAADSLRSPLMPDVRQCLASECPRVLHFARARHVSSPASARRTGIPPFCELNATFPCLRPPRVRNLPFLPPSSLPARALPAVPVRCPGSSRPQTSRVGQALFLSPSRPFPVLRHISPVISSLGRHGGSPAPPAAPPSELSENYRSSTPRQSSTASPNPGMQRTRYARR